MRAFLSATALLLALHGASAGISLSVSMPRVSAAVRHLMLLLYVSVSCVLFSFFKLDSFACTRSWAQI